ncbi:MAG: chorismate synthase [Spirochaetaceae bacterium]|jgi:chorismate synthase|nr:chorismate synthase [Spirochaetaceae bacterium]
MAGNRFGTIFTVTTFGESHGPACGAVVEGCPAGVSLDREILIRELRRRRPRGAGGTGGAGGGDPLGASTARAEEDDPEILSGVFGGKTLGTPIAILVRNRDHHSSDYDELRDLYRPGHADWTWEAKYAFRDHRGGGRSSGRETLGRVAGGAVAKAFLAAACPALEIRAWPSAIAGIPVPGPEDAGFDWEEAGRNPLAVPHREAAAEILALIERLRKEGDSAGGVVSCRVTGLPPGLGEPVFDKLDGRIAAAMVSIGAVKGVELGAGFAAARGRGSSHNDGILPGEAAPPLPGIPSLAFRTNHAGGVLGGISTGAPLEFRTAFKPVPSIAKPQRTLDRHGSPRDLIIRGRHDVCIVPRAVPVVEAMTALVLADLLLLNRCARL